MNKFNLNKLLSLQIQQPFINTLFNLQDLSFQVISFQIPNFMSYIDEFIHRLNSIAPEAQTILKNIQSTDFQTEKLKIDLDQKRHLFLLRLQHLDQRKNPKQKNQLDKMHKQILKINNILTTLSKQKVQLAEKLYNAIHQPTEKLQKEMHFKKIDKIPISQMSMKKKKGKKPKGRPTKGGQWEYDPNQPKYCYCAKPSFGEMVMCQNTYCQREWFHLQCIDEKKLPQKWYCKNCRVQIQRKG